MRYPKLGSLAVVAALVLTAACSRDPQKLKVEYLTAGDRYMKEGHVNEAIISYRNAVAQDAMFAEARTKLSAAYKLAGDKGGAMREAVRAADLLPNDSDAQLEAGKWLLESGQFEDARQRANNILTRDPKHVEGLILLGNSLVGLKDLNGAIKQIEDAIEADPHRTLSYSNLGLLQLAKGSRSEAESSLKRAVEVEPKSVVARLSLANFYWASGQLSEAEPQIRAAVAIDPKSPQANKTMAALLLALNRTAEAEPYLKNYASTDDEVGAKLVLSDYYFSLGRQEDGVAVLKSSLIDPKAFAGATLRLAAVEYKAQRFDQAYKMVESVLAKEPKSEDARIVKARFLVNQKRFAEALPFAKTLVTENPQSVGSHLVYAAALEDSGEIEGAIDELKEVVKLQPSSPVALAKLSDLFFRQGDLNAAAEFIGQVVKQQPNWLVARFLFARALVALNNLPRAEQEIAYLAKVAPKSAQVKKLEGDVAWARKDYNRARTAYTKATELDPTAFDAFTAMVRVDVIQRRPEVARSRLEARLAEKPNDKDTQLFAANMYMVLGDPASAEKAFKRVIEIDNSSMEAYAQLGSVYMTQNKLEEARKEFEKAAEREPDRFVAAKTMVGILLTMEGRHDEARAQYKKVLDIDSSAAVAANNLAYYYSSGKGTDSLDVALSLAQTAKSKLATNAQVNDTLGWIYYKKGLANMAVQPLRESVRAVPNDPVTLYHLGMTQLELKQTREARESLQQALRLKSDFEGANEARQALASINR